MFPSRHGAFWSDVIDHIIPGWRVAKWQTRIISSGKKDRQRTLNNRRRMTVASRITHLPAAIDAHMASASGNCPREGFSQWVADAEYRWQDKARMWRERCERSRKMGTLSASFAALMTWCKLANVCIGGTRLSEKGAALPLLGLSTPGFINRRCREMSQPVRYWQMIGLSAANQPCAWKETTRLRSGRKSRRQRSASQFSYNEGSLHTGGAEKWLMMSCCVT